MWTETHENWHSTHQHWNHARSSTISARHCADKHIHCCSSACGTDNRWSCPHYGSGMHTRLYAWYLSGASRLYPAYSKRIHGIVRFCDAQMQSESKAIMSTSNGVWVSQGFNMSTNTPRLFGMLDGYVLQSYVAWISFKTYRNWHKLGSCKPHYKEICFCYGSVDCIADWTDQQAAARNITKASLIYLIIPKSAAGDPLQLFFSLPTCECIHKISWDVPLKDIEAHLLQTQRLSHRFRW